MRASQRTIEMRRLWLLCGLAIFAVASPLHADDDAAPIEDEVACPVARAKVVARCAAGLKTATAACDATASESNASCAQERDECLEVEKASRGIGPATAPTCLPTYQRCMERPRRTRSLCVATATDERAACAEGIDVRAARCAVDVAVGAKARKPTCTALCRAEAVAKVSACGRGEKAKQREAAAERDASRAECVDMAATCRKQSGEGCDVDFSMCMEGADMMYGDAVGTPGLMTSTCVDEVKSGVLGCIRECVGSDDGDHGG